MASDKCANCPGADDCTGCQHEPKQVDPWELLRELYHACRYLSTDNRDGNEDLMARASAAIRHHDEGAKNGKP
jgi:hypothetical protein